MWRLPWIAFAVAFGLTWLFTPMARKLAVRCGAVAIPRDRDVHKQPLPKWGGLAMVAAFLITLGLVFTYSVVRDAGMHLPSPWNAHHLRQFAGIVSAAILIAVVGAIDDKWEISALWQSVALVAAGTILVVLGVRIEGISNPFYAPPPNWHHVYDPRSWVPFPFWFSALATIVWVFVVSKTVDFIDGLDGLAAGVSGICALTLAFMSAVSAQNGQYEVTIMAAALVGVCAGFLKYNFNPASIIMGTVGAQFLGFVLAAIAIAGTIKIAATVSVALPLLVLGVPIGDGIRVVFQRILKNTPAYLPDKTSHIHHILINRCLSQKKAVLLIYSITAGCCLIAFVLLRMVH
jgi:UDP-GlcNAc:undecaprenyl-phosphate GlcNAc-1-phosphate transferase